MRAQIIFLVLVLFGSTSILAKPERKPTPKLPDKASLEVPYQQNSLTRVDPHGSPGVRPTPTQVQQQNECQVCHYFQEDNLRTRPKSVVTCFNCHNKSPHSGVEEHLRHKVSCIDCHTLHRGTATAWTAPSGKFNDLPKENLESGFVRKNSRSPMLRKTCVECHKN